MADSNKQQISKEEISLSNSNFSPSFRKALQKLCNRAREEVLDLMAGNPVHNNGVLDNTYVPIILVGKNDYHLAA